MHLSAEKERERENGRSQHLLLEGKLSGYLTFIHHRGFLAGAQVHAMQPGYTNFALSLSLPHTLTLSLSLYLPTTLFLLFLELLDVLYNLIV